VGKGIIFDTGGTNLKPFKAMLDMHHDMAGSAVAVATLLALTRLQVPFAVDCWIAITENRLSGNAYKSRDIVTASNGTTIEVIHTDAEGRMALQVIDQRPLLLAVHRGPGNDLLQAPQTAHAHVPVIQRTDVDARGHGAGRSAVHR
jgi:hypothetical protein